MESENKIIGIENKLDIAVDQKVETNASVGADVSVGVKPVSVETNFETKVELKFPEIQGGYFWIQPYVIWHTYVH